MLVVFRHNNSLTFCFLNISYILLAVELIEVIYSFVYRLSEVFGSYL